ncbi:MAG: DUF6371 domain-containing protein [Algoriphagus sp.]|uniref:DUF6965 family protein n=1 Tax=Algoriphagus sp. TaxID=1872435 RepID=UPI00263263DB|nr:DUF6371 domain-containing protein [Algoriphagus sp.]MDG1276934.1 DUF6371 domain-containing protein [Algoriphagus sp.]
MNTEHRYIFEKGSKKSHCPECTKKRFVRYIDTKTGKYLPEQYGRCDRESKCCYFLNPYQDGYAKSIWEQEQGNKTNWKRQFPTQKKRPLNKLKSVFIPLEVFSQTRTGYENNVFIQNLLTQVPFPFEVQDVEKVISLYHLGTVQNGYRKGANTFPFIDVNNNVRAIQVKQFDETNHTIGTDFLHSIIEKHYIRNNEPLPNWLEAYNKNETKVSCLFGEHMLSRYPDNPVALVEAPKTAIYGTLYFGFPEQPTNLLWLAVYNLSSLNLNKCKELKGRSVFLFPDLSKEGRAFNSWCDKLNKIQKNLPGTYFQVSELLEQLATEQDKEKGKDIADYLIEQDWRLFRKHYKREEPKVKLVSIETSIREKSEKSEALEKTFFSQPANEILTKANVQNLTKLTIRNEVKEKYKNWDQEIAEIEGYFSRNEGSKIPVKLNDWSTITNFSQFLESHLSMVKSNNGNPTYRVYLERLIDSMNI